MCEPGDVWEVCCVCARTARSKGRISGVSVGHYERAYLKRSLSPLTPSFAVNSWVTAAAEPPWSLINGGQFSRDCLPFFFIYTLALNNNDKDCFRTCGQSPVDRWRLFKPLDGPTRLSAEFFSQKLMMKDRGSGSFTSRDSRVHVLD